MVNTNPVLEVWQRGSIVGVPPLLQPVAHALLQAREELELLLIDFPDALLWEKPAALASPAFHLQHLSGVLDRVFTYAKGKSLNATQLQQLKEEDLTLNQSVTVKNLQQRFSGQVNKAIEQLKHTDQNSLTECRGVGRQLLPSTQIGLLVHGAEHTMRHLGQLLVTVKLLKYVAQNTIA